MELPPLSEPDPRRREPLWDRVDRNRVRLAVFVGFFVITVVAVFDLLFLIGTALLSVRVILQGGFLYSLSEWSSFLTAASVGFAIVASGWALIVLTRSERWFLRRVEAHLVMPGELLDTKYALKDMALAGGLPVAPALHVVETNNVNAFAFTAPNRRPVIGVTRGLVEKLSPDEQRAIFANLVARMIRGDVLIATAITALVWPVHAWRDSQLQRSNRGLNAVLLGTERPDDNEMSPFGLLLFPLAFVGEVLAFGYRSKQLRAAEKADAEGMLLLKDPQSMLSALEKCVRFDNVVPSAGETFGDLFYCWPGDSTNDADDPEWRRIARLREVLGVAGM